MSPTAVSPETPAPIFSTMSVVWTALPVMVSQRMLPLELTVPTPCAQALNNCLSYLTNIIKTTTKQLLHVTSAVMLRLKLAPRAQPAQVSSAKPEPQELELLPAHQLVLDLQAAHLVHPPLLRRVLLVLPSSHVSTWDCCNWVPISWLLEWQVRV